MTSWTVLLLSTDATLIAPLADQLRGVARLEAAGTASAALSQLADVRPQLFLVDARTVTDGGHASLFVASTCLNAYFLDIGREQKRHKDKERADKDKAKAKEPSPGSVSGK